MGNEGLWLLTSICACMVLFANGAKASANESYALAMHYQLAPPDSGDEDTNDVKLRYPIKDNPNPYETESNPFDLAPPKNVESSTDYDPESGKVHFEQKVGKDINYKPPSYMTFEDYLEYEKQKTIKDYWNEKAAAANKSKKDEEEELEKLQPSLKIENEAFDRIFGGNSIDIKPNITAELSFGARISKTENPVIPIRNRRITTFQFDQSIQANVIGNVGDKVKVNINYNTQATFNFQNQIKLDYTGYEDEILQDIELGHVTLPLNTTLIQGSQSLFGVKTKWQFGKLTVTNVISEENGQRNEVESKGGAQIQEYEVEGDNYEKDKHYFLSHYFRDQFEEAVANPPTLNTGINITKVEVWVTNTRTQPENTRDIVALQDLGEIYNNGEKIYNNQFVRPGTITSFADNKANTLYEDVVSALSGNGRSTPSIIPVLSGAGLNPGLDYEKVELARKLKETDYVLNAQLGYISLKQRINANQVLAVAFEYTYRGERYQVGEFSTDITQPKPLVLKMLKSTQLNTKTPMWDLMMKNIYNIGAYRVNPDEFKFNVWYLDKTMGVDINFLPEENYNDSSLVQLLGLDKLDINNRPYGDGVFDFVTDLTIFPQTGRIMFPLLEPFGSGLRQRIGDALGDEYAFDSLYTRTQQDAQNLFPEKNRFSLKGEYKSDNSSEISLNALNVPEGSVVVTAGGIQLQEDIDYTVDYTLGRVKIINQSILESNTPVKVSTQSNQMFSQQQKSLIGFRFDYKISEDILVGGTFMRLKERPFTQKVDFGYEPISNAIYGIDGSYKKEVPFLTRMVDAIPFIDTKEKSSVSFTGEFAQLLPGHNKAIGEEGNSYIDDFEGSQTTIDLRTFSHWSIASTPQGQEDKFPEGGLFNNLATGYNRAQLAWRTVDPTFYQGGQLEGIDNDVLSNHYQRQVLETEVFPNRQVGLGQPVNISMLDLSYYPTERGMYNYDLDGIGPDGIRYSAGVDVNGKLINPQERWGGIMRRIDQNDFESANIEFLQIWIMDPFNEDYEGSGDAGNLYINFGNVSEDVMADGQTIFEQGLPETEEDATDLIGDTLSEWGRVVRGAPFSTGFSNEPSTREFQDVGLDGLRDEEETIFFTQYLAKAERLRDAGLISDSAYQAIAADPSNDNYNYFRDDDYDEQGLNLLERYKRFNGVDGNSPTDQQSSEANAEGYSTSASLRPDKEDINSDNVINPLEAYYEYTVKISPQDLNPANIGRNFITDVLETSVNTPDGERRTVRWYQIKIPIRTDQKRKVGSISDFRSIRFMRMYLRGFEEPVHLRFARLELVRGEWRKYQEELDENPEGIATDGSSTFNVAAVNLEENGNKSPVNYVIPPGIIREKNYNTTNVQEINEQALSMSVCDLPDGQANAAFRNVTMDMRMYGELKMFTHAESVPGQPEVLNGDLNVFIRVGTDFKNNYYEYEIPLQVTPEGRYNPDLETTREQVWPTLNELNIDLEAWTDLKQERDKQVLVGDPNFIRRRRFEGTFENGKIYVVGNPNLGEVKTIMIGVRNPRATPGSTTDDGAVKCVEVWANELRLSDFNDQKGYAAIGRATAKLADFSTISTAASISTPGFGGIDKKVSERETETKRTLDASASLNLSKFFPKDWGIQLPMYVSYSRNTSEPLFSPIAPDIRFSDYVDAYDFGERDSVRAIGQTRIIRKSINFANIRKNKNPNKEVNTPIDISNFSASYSYNVENRTSFEIARDMTRTHRANLSYNYQLQPENKKPFKDNEFLKKSGMMKLARETNFYLLPKQISMTNDFLRRYNAYQVRNNNPGITADLPEFYNKTFTWDRGYNFKYDITKNLKFGYTANNRALIDEPLGAVERNENEEGQYDFWKQEVWKSVKDLGTNLDYRHTTNFNYTIPLSEIKSLNWINSSVQHNGTYSWKRAAFGQDTLGNTIQNSSQISVNGTFNLRSLYNKSKYLREINQKIARRERQKRTEARTGQESKDKVKVSILDRGLKVLTSVSNVSVTYSQTEGLLIPGYGQETRAFGLEEDNNSLLAPGLGFVTGRQGDFGDNEQEFYEYASEQSWLVRTENMNQKVSDNYTENINIRASLQPINDLRVTLSSAKMQSDNLSLFYRYNPNSDDWLEESPVRSGNYSVTFSTIRTAFESERDEGGNAVWDQFLTNRQSISQRIGEVNEDSQGEHALETGFSEGYGALSADVLIPSFIAAYSGQSTDDVKLRLFDILPKVDWNVTYTGLSKIAWVQQYFQSITINHGYKSQLTSGGYISNQRFNDKDSDGFYNIISGLGRENYDLDSNYFAQYQYNSISISESFSPIINIDMTFKNSVSARFEIRKDRTINLNIANSQISENTSNTITIGSGYTIKDVEIPIQNQQGKNLKSDLKLRGDFSIRQNRLIIRDIIQNTHTSTSGQWVSTFKITADYRVSRNVNFRAFVDRVGTRPFVTNSFPTANTNIGISLRITLG